MSNLPNKYKQLNQDKKPAYQPITKLAVPLASMSIQQLLNLKHAELMLLSVTEYQYRADKLALHKKSEAT